MSEVKENERSESLKELKITVGRKLSYKSDKRPNPENIKRAGKCNTFGTVFKLIDAKEKCYKGTNNYDYYIGQLLGNEGNNIIDQYFKQ